MSDKKKKKGWFSRLKEGLSKSSTKISQGISDIVKKRKLDDAALEELEELLISADLGVEASMNIVEKISKARFGKEVSDEEIKQALADAVTEILQPVTKTLETKANPHIILVIGVNGTGKTTTIGKLAASFQEQGKSVMMAAGDTFRAAAIEQLLVWGERNKCKVIHGKQGADAAGLVYDAVKQAQDSKTDVLLIDTAGRLHNKKDLMEELAKIKRTLEKLVPDAPHHCLLVLDATTGQNAVSQTETFREMVDVTGLIVTKLDGTARGGVLVSLAQKFNLPVYAIGVGEGIDDLQPFKAEDFARNLVGLG